MVNYKKTIAQFKLTDAEHDLALEQFVLAKQKVAESQILHVF